VVNFVCQGHLLKDEEQGQIHTMWKLWFTRSNYLIYMISENMLRKSGKIGKIIYKIGENRNFHIVSI